ncbi:hypothetical protein K491DRAFT_719612 [Lophiostoma macrostomum CBS 122681]|uniref:F-box domain-containing protein n=1 Tax=Lophiostoma macrostomum CBS 122681 TaxID=1314788 RepID=A0A6A6SZM4_9PLEO|nr:hypothetical protein K491DRAFT_719612 [Lophiostoma macrostomum CBS 122681]
MPRKGGRGRRDISTSTAPTSDHDHDNTTPNSLPIECVSARDGLKTPPTLPGKIKIGRDERTPGRSHQLPPPVRKRKSSALSPDVTTHRKRVRASQMNHHQKDLRRNKEEKRFPFLRLPSEIRNMIYREALRIMGDLEKRHRHENAQNPWGRIILYLPLTQACQQVRAEFRPLWMDRFAVYQAEVTSYIGSFLKRPTYDSSVNSQDMYTSTRGTFVLSAGCRDVPGDLLSLVQLRMACPEYKLKFNVRTASASELQSAIRRIVLNTNPTWRKDVMEGKITGIRVEGKWELPPDWSPRDMGPHIQIYLPRTYYRSLTFLVRGFLLADLSLIFLRNSDLKEADDELLEKIKAYQAQKRLSKA